MVEENSEVRNLKEEEVRNLKKAEDHILESLTNEKIITITNSIANIFKEHNVLFEDAISLLLSLISLEIERKESYLPLDAKKRIIEYFKLALDLSDGVDK